MPTLGFLKKKRTREDKTDPSTSNTNSNVVAHSQVSPVKSNTSSPANKKISDPSTQQQSSAQPQGQQQQMNQQSSSPTYAAGSRDSQNLPSINNLINAPQGDGAAGAQGNTGSPSQLQRPAVSPEAGAIQSASPGTDPSRMLQQQQQAHPVPIGTQSNGQSNQPQAAGHEQHQNGHHQAQPSQSQPRVTKGKYTLPDFEILRTLGTGSFGRVHLVQSKHNHRFYAIKVLKKAQVVKMKQVEHTNDERRMLSDVKHPFLITLWGTFQDWKSLYMVMDFVEGGELFSLLRKSGVSLFRAPPLT